MAEEVKHRHAHSIKSTAVALDTNERAVYTLIATGQLRSFKLGKRRLVPDDEIKALVARKLAEAQ